jgi:hypothetical protein
MGAPYHMKPFSGAQTCVTRRWAPLTGVGGMCPMLSPACQITTAAFRVTCWRPSLHLFHCPALCGLHCRRRRVNQIQVYTQHSYFGWLPPCSSLIITRAPLVGYHQPNASFCNTCNQAWITALLLVLLAWGQFRHMAICWPPALRRARPRAS